MIYKEPRHTVLVFLFYFFTIHDSAVAQLAQTRCLTKGPASERVKARYTGYSYGH